MSEPISKEIERARRALSLSPQEFASLSREGARKAADMVAHKFLGQPSARSWWERLSASGVSARFRDGQAFTRLSQIVPRQVQRAWLIADSESQLPVVYVGSAHAIERILGECYAFEYYVVSPALDWLVCESHHDVLRAVGEVVESRLRELVDAHPEQVDWVATK